MKNTFHITIRTFIVLVSLTLVAGGAHAQKNAPAVPIFASVDLQKVLQESDSRKKATADFDAIKQGYNDVLHRLDNGSTAFLIEGDLRRLAALYQKPSPSDAEKTEIAQLEKKGTDTSTNFKALEQNASPTDVQKKQYADLLASQQSGNEVLKSIANSYSQDALKRGNEIEQKSFGEVKTAIAKIAQERGLSVVFNADVALYTANDITADVIKYLNKNSK